MSKEKLLTLLDDERSIAVIDDLLSEGMLVESNNELKLSE